MSTAPAIQKQSHLCEYYYEIMRAVYSNIPQVFKSDTTKQNLCDSIHYLYCHAVDCGFCKTERCKILWALVDANHNLNIDRDDFVDIVAYHLTRCRDCSFFHHVEDLDESL